MSDVSNNKLQDCNPIDKREKIQRKKITTSEDDKVLSESKDGSEQIISDL